MATDKVAYWLDIADEDLGVAVDLYKAKRWLYVAFMCHQVIEPATLRTRMTSTTRSHRRPARK